MARRRRTGGQRPPTTGAPVARRPSSPPQTSAPASTTGRAPIGITSPKPRRGGLGPLPGLEAGAKPDTHLRVNASGPEETSIKRLLAPLAVIECFFLALMTVAPIGGVSQTISPLARAWPWLLAPARLVFGDALVDASIPPERGWAALALYAVLLVGASCAAVVALARSRGVRVNGTRTLALVLGGAALLGLTCALLPALPSDDVFSYILYGRIAVIHHANPLITTPSAFPRDPFLALVFWRNTRSVYGPVWLLLSSGVTLLAQALGGALATYVALFKVLGLAAHLANAALIWGILGRLAPGRRLWGTLLYAWNPLCLLEFCASAHNDAVLLTFALLGVYWLVRGQEVPALLAFGLSIATKYVLLALLPFYLALIVSQLRRKGETPRRILGALAWRLAVVLAVVVLTALPYWDGPRSLGAIAASPPAQQLDNSLLEVAQWPLRALLGVFGVSAGAAASFVQTGLKIAGVLVFAAVWLRQFRRATSLEGMLLAWGWTLFAYVTAASGWFWPWYATWGVALVALLPEGAADRRHTAAGRWRGDALRLLAALCRRCLRPARARRVWAVARLSRRALVASWAAPATLAFARYTVFHRERTGAAPGARSRLSTWPTVRSRRDIERRMATPPNRLGMPI